MSSAPGLGSVAPPDPSSGLREEGALRAAYPAVGERAARKVIDRLDRHCCRFIALSPFAILSTVGPDGTPDLSPRGGGPGFARVLDERTVVLPDRPGNNRLDNLANAVARPGVALLFMVPGIDETLRVYGRAQVVPATTDDAATDDADSTDDTDDDDDASTTTARRAPAPPARRGVAPSRTVLRIDVTRALFHCAKAVMRAGLWDPDGHVERSSFPTMGEIVADHSGLPGPVESHEEMVARYAPTL